MHLLNRWSSTRIAASPGLPKSFIVRLVMAALAVGLTWAVPAQAAMSPLTEKWGELRRNDLRVATVMYRLTIANRQHCRGAREPQPGFALHSLEQYGPADRKKVAQNFGLGAHVGVMAVVADSPAARAGLRADDQLVAVNGRELPSLAVDAAQPTNARLEAAREALLAEMQPGEVALLVTGSGGDHTVRFTPEEGCRSAAELVPGDEVNASADGRRVIVSAGLLERCATEDDLAFVIAHELAHNLLHHASRLARLGISSDGLLALAGSGTAEMRKTEEEADRLGVRLAMAAGYDLSGAGSFLSGLQARDREDGPPSTHPALDRRLALLTAAIAEARGRPGSDSSAFGQVASTSRIPK